VSCLIFLGWHDTALASYDYAGFYFFWSVGAGTAEYLILFSPLRFSSFAPFCPGVDELLATGGCSLDGLRTLIVPKERRRTFADVVSLYKALRLAGVLKQKISTAKRYIQ
jgi:hypothetical protein